MTFYAFILTDKREWAWLTFHFLSLSLSFSSTSQTFLNNGHFISNLYSLHRKKRRKIGSVQLVYYLHSHQSNRILLSQTVFKLKTIQIIHEMRRIHTIVLTFSFSNRKMWTIQKPSTTAVVSVVAAAAVVRVKQHTIIQMKYVAAAATTTTTMATMSSRGYT